MNSKFDLYLRMGALAGWVASLVSMVAISFLSPSAPLGQAIYALPSPKSQGKSQPAQPSLAPAPSLPLMVNFDTNNQRR